MRENTGHIAHRLVAAAFTIPHSVAMQNGNISAMTWSNSGYDQLRGYKFTYDRMSRLRSAVYGERSDLSNKVNRFNESVDEYSRNGSIKHLVRRGKKNDGEYGKIDNLHAYYDGNQLQRVEDNAIKLLYNGSMDFKDSGDSEVEYTYNDNGALTSDKNRGIALIEYDNCNNPKRIQFTNGNVTEYIYTATGQKLRTIHYTAISNITVPMGTTHTLTQNETQSIDSTDYLLAGTYRLTNGMRSMYLFPGGYCNLNDPTVTNTGDLGTDSISYHYYNKDHLGNNREVINEQGHIEQVVHYYPFGTPFTDGSSTNIGLQPYLYGNKELDMMHGLNTYDFGARNYNPLLPMWDRVDPMCEKYYWMNPYVYCGNSPVLFVDPTGMIIDLSAMTDEERESYYKELDLLRSGSQLFDTLIETLENSSNTIYVRYGDTSDVSEKEVNGHFFFKDGLPTVEFSKNQNTMFSTYSEEFFHAYQNENIQNYSGEFNYEFEAKVFAICVGEEYGGYGNFNGFEDFNNNLSNHTYGNQKNPIKPDTVLKSYFIRDYMNAAESYRHYNVLNNVGNSNYKKRTTVSPYSLQTIVLKTFLDRF